MDGAHKPKFSIHLRATKMTFSLYDTIITCSFRFAQVCSYEGYFFSTKLVTVLYVFVDWLDVLSNFIVSIVLEIPV